MKNCWIFNAALLKGFVCVVVLCLLLLCPSCKEEGDIVGRSLQISTDSLYVDTLTDISLFSVREDSLLTSRVRTNLLGEVQDPVFGVVKADLYAQFRLSANAINFGEEAELDSVVLSVPYGGFFGDTSNALKIGVYELSEPLYRDSSYYSTQRLACHAQNLVEGSPVFTFHPLTKQFVDGEMMEAQLRIPLDKAFFTTRFLGKSGGEELSNNSHFLEYFKGVVLKTEGRGGSGCLAYMNLLSNNAAITLYYHNNQHDSLSFRLVSNDSTNFFSQITHRYEQAVSALRAQLEQDYSACGEVAYLQAGSGLKLRVKFPFLSRYEGRHLAIHKAELILSRAATTDGYNPYFAPGTLTMYYKKDSSLSSSYYLPDYLKLGGKYFGGSIDTSDYSYHFLLTDYIQQLLMGTISSDYPLYIVVNAAATQATRLQIVGPQSVTEPDRRLRMVLTYSLIPE